MLFSPLAASITQNIRRKHACAILLRHPKITARRCAPAVRTANDGQAQDLKVLQIHKTISAEQTNNSRR